MLSLCNKFSTFALYISLLTINKLIGSMKLITGIVATVLSLTSFAQQEVIIIDKGDLKDFDKRKTKEIRYNDNIEVFKFAPLNMLVGEINFGYERQVSQKGSIDIEVGPTISKISLGIDNHYIDPNMGPTADDNSGLGFFTTFGYRFYPLDETEALNRFYVSPVLKFKLLNHTVEDLSGTLQNAKGSNTQLNFYFNFGYQLWAAKSFSVDFYGGVGIGYQQLVDHRIEYQYVNNDWNYYWFKTSSSGARYVANVGIKFGIGQE